MTWRFASSRLPLARPERCKTHSTRSVHVATWIFYPSLEVHVAPRFAGGSERFGRFGRRTLLCTSLEPANEVLPVSLPSASCFLPVDKSKTSLRDSWHQKQHVMCIGVPAQDSAGQNERSNRTIYIFIDL